MKTRNWIILLLALLNISFAAQAVWAQKQPAGDEKFAAVGYLPSGAGRAMVGAGSTFNIDIYINEYSPNEDVKLLEKALVQGGSNGLLKAVEKMGRIGKITLTGRLGFYDLKFIRSRDLGGGRRRIIALTDRPIGGLEALYSGRSMDYNFGILQLDISPDKKGKKEKGQGTLIYAAKVKLIKGNIVEIENRGISPIQLRGVQKL